MLEEIRADGTPLQQTYARRAFGLDGEELWIEDARSNRTAYTHDGFNRLMRTTFPDTTYEELGYDASGNIVSMRRRGGETITQSFDGLNRLAARAVPAAASSGLGARETAWTYDAMGRILSIAETGAAWTGSQSLVNAYDTAGRLSQQARTLPATYLGLTTALTQTVSYQYDANGNRTRLALRPDGLGRSPGKQRTRAVF